MRSVAKQRETACGKPLQTEVSNLTAQPTTGVTRRCKELMQAIICLPACNHTVPWRRQHGGPDQDQGGISLMEYSYESEHDESSNARLAGTYRSAVI